MADYHSPTVVDPVIPLCDMTSLERLILGGAFFASRENEDHVYLSADLAVREFFPISPGDLRAALLGSSGIESRIAGFVEKRLAEYDAMPMDERPVGVDIDLSSSPVDWRGILQDIVRRSSTLDEIVVMTAFTCSSMRADGFGGSVTRISNNAVQYASTDSMLENMRDGPTVQSSSDSSGRDACSRLEAIAYAAGWDNSTLLLLIGRWLDQSRHMESLMDYLDRLASDEDD